MVVPRFCFRFYENIGAGQPALDAAAVMARSA